MPPWSPAERHCLHLLKTPSDNKLLLSVHSFLLRRHLLSSNLHLLTLLLSSLSRRLPLLPHALRLFHHLPHNLHDNFLFNSLLRSLHSHRLHLPLLSLYPHLLLTFPSFSPDHFTFPLLLSSAASLSLLPLGLQLHSHLLRFGFHHHPHSSSSLLHFYTKCQQLPDARKVFDEMTHPCLHSWTAMLLGYARAGDVGLAEGLFGSMPERDVVANNAMIDVYVKAGDLGSARKVFDGMEERNVVSWTSLLSGLCKGGDMVGALKLFDEMPERNLFSWNVMIGGFCQNREPGRALELFRELQAGAGGGLFEPDDVSVVSVLPAVADMGAIEIGRWIHSYARRKGFDRRSNVCTALIDMYAKCGDVCEARRVFDGMAVKEIVSWNALINGLAVNGHPREALDVFMEMRRIGACPNEITMIGVLSACNHGGLVDKGRRWFKEMDVLGIRRKIEHYGCMVDILGRGGYLEEAEKLIDEMPCEPNGIILSSLLFACGCYGDIERAERIMELASKIEPSNVTNYVIMRNLYAHAKRWKDVDRIKRTVWEFGGKRDAGCSLIEVASRVHEFVSSDRAHSDWELIYMVLGRLQVQMKGQHEKEWELDLTHCL